MSQAEYGQLRLVRYSHADASAMNPLLLIALPITVLLTQITKLKLESYEKELEIRDAQLQYLRAQIRPHFYLNCLKNLYAMAGTEVPEQMQESILMLSKYMRYIFADQDHFTLLQNELESCQNYVGSFASINTGFAPECRVDVDDKLMTLEIPPVSLLTLVENAVKYSLREDASFQLLITANILSAGAEGDMVNITVRDNGPGFPQEMLAQLNRLKPDSETDTHVGIRNVMRRFVVLYGDRFQIGFFNGGAHEVYCGARIELFFPLNKEPSS